MSKTKVMRKGEKALSELIRKELASEGNRRSLGRIPAFRPEDDLPGHFRDLLEELDRSEARSSR